MSQLINILVIRLSSLGDIILAGPTVVNLKVNYPRARIHFLAKPEFVDVAAGLPCVDTVIPLSATTPAGLVSAALELERRRFDLIVDLHGNLRSRTLTRLIPATDKVTVRKHRLRRELVTRYKRFDLAGGQAVDNYNAALRSLDANFILAATTPRLNQSYAAASAIDQTIDDWSRQGRPLVALAPGARHETKRAPLELFGALADELVRRRGVSLVSIFQAGGASLSLAERFSSDRYCELIDGPLPQVACVLRRADLTISNDSGLAHLSSAVGTPTAVTYGPTHPALGFAPRGVFDTTIENPEPCRPCSLHGAAPCRREQRFCFTALDQSSIAESLANRLDLSRRRRPALFLDRDGSIVKEKEFLADPEGVELYPGVAEALRSAAAAGFALVVISNQSGVARGYFDESAVRAVNQRLAEILGREGISLDGVYFSPCHPAAPLERYRTPDGGRKPSDELFWRAARELELDVRRSWVIGDRPSDFLSAVPLGARGALLRTGYGADWEKRLGEFGDLAPDLVADDLPAAIDRILGDLK